MTIISILGIVVFSLLVVGGYITIKSGRIAQALISLSGVAGVGCGIIGFSRINDHLDKNDVSGSILLSIGILMIFVVGVAFKILFSTSTPHNSEQGSAHQSTTRSESKFE